MILHTIMDSLREDGTREINHHGSTITVGNIESKDAGDKLFKKVSSPTYQAMTQTNEKQKVDATKDFYDRAQVRRVRCLKLGEFAGFKCYEN